MSRRKFSKHQFTAEERAEYMQAKRQESRERLEQAVAELASSDGWRRWCESRALFHRYSLNNSLLIACQRPDATLVASYRTWSKAGRQVRKGQKGIAILVPTPVKVRADAPESDLPRPSNTPRFRSLEDGPEPEARTIMRFKVGHVFDVSQTDGEDLPQLERQPIDGDSHADYLAKLDGFAGSLGVTVDRRDLSDSPAGGWFNSDEALIVVDSATPANAQVRTLVHELAHALGVGYREFGREDAEVIADSAAFVVCGSLGLDTSGESVPYVAGWADGDAGRIRKYAETVDQIARKLEAALDLDGFGAYEAGGTLAA